MNVLALGSGVGGLELGISIKHPTARPVCWVERDRYAASVLAQRMQEGLIHEAPVWDDVAPFDGKPWCGKVDCISAGYPCQPFSGAGRKRGTSDGRWLWDHVRRIVGEVRPATCFFENVPRHLRVGFEQVHDNLREMGYRVAAGLFSAAEVGAPMVVPPDVDAPGPVRFPGQRAAHGVGQQRGEVVDARPAFNVRIGQERTVRLGDDQAKVVRLGLRDRLGQRPEVGLPGVVLLAQPFQPSLHEGGALAEFQVVLLVHYCRILPTFTTSLALEEPLP